MKNMIDMIRNLFYKKSKAHNDKQYMSDNEFVLVKIDNSKPIKVVDLDKVSKIDKIFYMLQDRLWVDSILAKFGLLSQKTIIYKMKKQDWIEASKRLPHDAYDY